MKAMDLNELVASTSTIKTIHRIMGDAVLLEVQLCDQAAWMWGDPGQIERLLKSLSSKAQEVMPEGGILCIETDRIAATDAGAFTSCDQPASGHILLSVSNIVDVTPDAKEHEPLPPEIVHADPGLATACAIIQQHHGHIEVVSKAGRGIAFRILFPALVDVLSDDDAAIDWTMGPHGTEGILIVEDNTGVRYLLTRALSCLGYRVYSVSSGRRALALAHAAPAIIDLAIVDVVMPEMRGPELVAQLYDIIDDLKVLYISGYPDAYLDDDVLVGGSARLIRKPFHLSELACRVRSELDAPLRNIFAFHENAQM
jgi:two-component system, cell cycle sensor histidine kinase and response regulator CckA